MSDLEATLYSTIGLVIGFVAHEQAQARAAAHFGDPGPARLGRVSFDPRKHADPLGTYILPGLLLLLLASGARFVPPFAYGKPMPIEPNHMWKRRRAYVITLLCGPAATLLIAVVAAAALRGVRSGALAALLARVLVVNVMMTVFNLMPVPPLDGSKILARFLPQKAGELMDGLQVYGGFFIIAIFFLLPAPVLSMVETLGNGLCRLLVGLPCL